MLKSRHEYGLVTVLLLWYVLSGIPTISAQQIAMEAIYGHIQPPASQAAETPKALHVSHELHRELHHSGAFLRANHAFDSDYNDKCTIGKSSSFYVRDLFNQTAWNTIEATCIKIVDGKFAVWVEAPYEADVAVRAALTEVWHHLTQQRVHNDMFSSQTPIAVLEAYFGSFPNTRGDGLVDILFLDIADEFETTGTYVAGFYDPVNNYEHMHSNRRDMIYVDLFPGLVHQNVLRAETAAATIVHELQHLIFSQYDQPDQDNLFLNEGLSEMAEIMAGFEPRNSQYYFHNPNRPLFSWDFTNPMPDYARGALFFTYLFEQIGFDHIRPMVHANTPQQQRVTDYVTRHTRFHFDDLFNDWGIALLKNNAEENERWGYKTPLLQPMRARPNVHSDEISILGAPSNPLSHTFHYFDLMDGVQIHLGNSQFNTTGYVQWPDHTNTQPSYNPPNTTFQAANRPHGSRYVVLSNPSRTDQRLPESVIAIGEKSGVSSSLAYDNGIPQVFINRASYLLLNDRMSEIAVIFYPEENSWLKDIMIMGVFLSEVQNSGVPKNAVRSLEIQIHSYEGDFILGQPLTPSFHWSFRRDFGDLGFERISLAPFYEELSQLGEPFVVRFSNSTESGNPFAVALSNIAPSSKSWFSTSDNEDWEPLRFSSDHSTPSTVWNAMVRSTMVTQALPASHIVVNPVMDYDYNRVYVQLNPPTHVELNEIRVAATLPDGRVRYGRFENERSDVMSPVYSFPLLTGPWYTFYYTQAETGSAQRYRSTWSWELPFEHSLQLMPNYPNPFNSETTLPFVVLANSEVQISVYNLLGQRIRRYPSRVYPAGQHAVNLDMMGLATGVYLVNWSVRVLSMDQMLIQTQKITFVK